VALEREAKMAARKVAAYEPYSTHQKMIERIYANRSVLGEAAQEIIVDIYERKPNTLSAKQITMMTEWDMKVRADVTEQNRRKTA
jgi:hypothetical protein